MMENIEHYLENPRSGEGTYYKYKCNLVRLALNQLSGGMQILSYISSGKKNYIVKNECTCLLFQPFPSLANREYSTLTRELEAVINEASMAQVLWLRTTIDLEILIV